MVQRIDIATIGGEKILESAGGRGSLRRWLNAFRHRLSKRSRTKPPDQFLDKFSSTTALDTRLHQTVPAHPSDGLCSRLSVDPSLPSHYRWLSVVSLAVLYNIVFVIGRAVFWEINRQAPALWWTLDYLCDFIYLADTLVHCHEGYLEQGLLVRDATKLRRYYFSKERWWLDVVSMLPTDLAYIWWAPSSCAATRLPCPIIVRINRLLRLPRMWEWFDRTETATGYPNAFRICKVVLAILVLIHWNACLYFAISYALGFSSDNWVYNINGAKNLTLSRQYIYSFYWSTLTLTTIGETPTPENDAEYLFVVADFLAGVLIFATIVGNIGSMISNMNVTRVEFQNRMDGVKQYMAFRKVGGELEARVIRWFAYTWAQSGALDEERVLAALPDKLKAEIAIRVHMDTLRQVRIFQDCEPGLLEALVLKLKLQVFSPGDYICRKGDVGKEMYIVKRGRLSVVADDGVTVLATLGAGSVFGEVSVLEIAGNRTGNRRTANVRSIGYSDLFCLAKRDLWETLADYPEARASLTERGCQLLRKDGLLDEAVFASAQQHQDTLESGVAKLEQTVENLNLRLARLLAEYSASQAKLKQRISKLEERAVTSPKRRSNHHQSNSGSGSGDSGGGASRQAPTSASTTATASASAGVGGSRVQQRSAQNRRKSHSSSAAAAAALSNGDSGKQNTL
ncbi:cyclic nucleotide-gated cation channel subunit A isoform X2 [Toxorhynchites rutilus septentrionalis]|uniref:cyclic nucleotide-gated cation channel subunit A isoform X2 n=1 Tax=Toxorhynchites rutilus septentrionalis TaxID=329112 RepID=UPI002478E29C|nr:cyclic nucleotide-gated cation channel subunit A isoform X2 [Toxorhynchites rutilus septentrionalis]XP_055634815.1 cyclic nucleotide-gated cation channel subunit A isoform X2 [Toxorhynchites rutilus septentrionalis]